MVTARRTSDEPAFILHSYDWSESSLILEAFTRHQGRVALVAKGAKKPTSNFRPVLLALQPLRLTYSAGAEGLVDIHTLRGAQWAGGHVMPSGAALLGGLYLNELLMRLLARDDPFAALFDVYTLVVRLLATQGSAVLEPVLRTFELVLLRELGLLPALDVQTSTQQPLKPRVAYTLHPQSGLCPVSAGARASLDSAHWQELHAALALDGCGQAQEPASAARTFAATLQICATLGAALKPQLRHVLQHHCGAPLLRTRQLMMELQNL